MVKDIASPNSGKHVIFIDNNTQRSAAIAGLTASGLKRNQVLNIASSATSGGIKGEMMAANVDRFTKDKDARVIFIDKQSASGYNLQAGDTLHVIGTPSDAANYLQAQGRLARMPRTGDVKIKTYRYTDAPFENQRWERLNTQIKMLKATAPAMFV
jgi:hypothetical protein